MYESFFAFERRPFMAAPVVDRYFPAGPIESARAGLSRCIERGDGPGMLCGGSGLGKTLLLEVLARQFRDQRTTVLLSGARITNRRELLQAILFELGFPCRHMDESELRLALNESLLRNATGRGLLLLVDEAHTLPVRLLEEVRLTTNTMREGQPLVALVLAGSLALEERLAHPKLESLHQRLAQRCYLEPLHRQETMSYLRQQVERCGAAVANVFNQGALEAIHTATGGVPRLINQVADHALMMAFADGIRPVDAMQVERAWADLQRLPAPWALNTDAILSGHTAMSSVVEFGALTDDQEESQPAPQKFQRTDGPKAGVPQPAGLTEAEFYAALPVAGESVDRRVTATFDALDEQLSGFAQTITGATKATAKAKPRAWERDLFEEAFEGQEEVLDDRLARLDAQRTTDGATAEETAAGEALVSFATSTGDADAELTCGAALDTTKPSEAAVTTNAALEGTAMAMAEAVWEPAIAAEHEAYPRIAHADWEPGAAPADNKAPLTAEHAAEFAADALPEVVVTDAPAAVAGTKQVTEVRRQEYRQLFARLRRGAQV